MSTEFVNIGTDKEPSMVPPEALRPDTKDGREYWEMVATGSIVLENQVLFTFRKNQ